jgi:hypothetical protein
MDQSNCVITTILDACMRKLVSTSPIHKQHGRAIGLTDIYY